MQSTDRFIVSPKNNEKFINTKKVNDKTLIINTSIEHAENVNRSGIVVSKPLNYEGNINVGDEVIVQHNIFRDYFDGNGLTRKSDFNIKDNFYYVPEELIYMVIKNGEKSATENYVFVEPIFEEVKWLGKVEIPHIGILKYSNKTLAEKGLKEGQKIAFYQGCEYEVNIEGERLYRMRTRRILAVLN